MVILFFLYSYLKLRVVLGAMIRYITFMCITEICCSRREESLNGGYLFFFSFNITFSSGLTFTSLKAEELFNHTRR